MNLSDTLNQALVHRLYPYSTLGPKQLAHALGISDDTLWRYRTGRTVIPGDTLIALMGFFRARGDFGFEAEIMAVTRETSERLRLATVNGEPWQVERLPISTLRHPTAQRLAALAESESDLLSAADNAGLLRECSIFRVLESGVIQNLTLGTSTGMRPSIRNAMMGLPVDMWPDHRFARLVKDHVLAAKKDGPSYHHLDGTVHGIRAPYRRSIFPAGEFAISFTEREVA